MLEKLWEMQLVSVILKFIRPADTIPVRYNVVLTGPTAIVNFTTNAILNMKPYYDYYADIMLQ